MQNQQAQQWSTFAPLTRDRVLESSPSSRIMMAGGNERYAFGLWEVTEGRFTTAHHGDDEIIRILRGSGVLRSNDGTVIELSPGAMFVMEDGFQGEWEIFETLQKSYVQVFTAAD